MTTIKHRSLLSAQAIARRAGLWIDRYERQTEARRAKIMATCEIHHVFDVGAHRGSYANGLRRHGYTGQISSFEPIPGAFAALQKAAARDSRWTVANVALSSEPGKGKLHLAGNEVSSSLRPMNQRHMDAAPGSRPSSTIDVRVDTIDRQAAAIGDPDMLKLDVQGGESDALAGAGAVLKNLQVIELELSFVELYTGQILIEEMIALLRGLGFSLAHFVTGFTDRRNGIGLQADGIFVRDFRRKEVPVQRHPGRKPLEDDRRQNR